MMIKTTGNYLATKAVENLFVTKMYMNNKSKKT